MRLFILYFVDPPILLAALRSLLLADGELALNVTVMDNSPARDLSEGLLDDSAAAAAFAALGARLSVHTPDVPLDFQRSHNLAQQQSYEEGLLGFYVMHSDGVLTSGADVLVPFAAALARAGWQPAGAARPVGLVFVAYDTLALFNPAATLAAGVWDVLFLTNYGTDVDYYHRIDLAGFAEANADDASLVGAEAAALGHKLAAAHETSHSLKSAAWACTRVMRMEHSFEGEWRRRYLKRKWGPAHNDGVAFQSVYGAAPQQQQQQHRVHHAAPTPLAAGGDWAYAGCYRDDAAARVMSTELPRAGSARICALAAARAGGLDVIALQHGGECSACSACNFTVHGRAPEQDACAPLGGDWLMQVFTLHSHDGGDGIVER